MKFNQITILEQVAIADNLIKILSKYSDKPIKYYDTPAGDDVDKINRIGDSDCLLATFGSKVSANVIEKTNLKYIGLCSTLYKGKNCNIDWDAVKKRGITITGLTNYGTHGTVEFTIAQIINYLKKGPNRELRGKDIGIIGMGDVGQRVAKALLFFKANLYYFNRSRKPDMEKLGVKYLDLKELLQKVEILSLNLPRNTMVLGNEEFQEMNVKVIINTGLGNPFDVPAFHDWQKRGGYGIFDAVSIGDVDKKTVKYYDDVSGLTEEAKVRQVKKVEENIIRFLNP